MKEKVIDVIFDPVPDTGNRKILDDDPKEIKENKIKFPYEAKKTSNITVVTTKRTFAFSICNGFVWNGADIPVLFWRIVGSRYNPEFRNASMIHDYMLIFKKYILNEILKNEITVKEYRRLTSLVFRHVIKKQGVGTVKANVMSYAVDVFQMINFKNWRV